MTLTVSLGLQGLQAADQGAACAGTLQRYGSSWIDGSTQDLWSLASMLRSLLSL